jgi:hypothetical protein
MKNLFNNISQEEKNRILEMHSGKKNVIYEQGIGSTAKLNSTKPVTQKKISGSAEQFLSNKSSQINTTLGIPKKSLNQCFKYFIENNYPGAFGVGEGEIKKYMDYLGVYGKIPGTGIPIPYQGDDLNQMQYFLWGDRVATNSGVYGSIETRTSEINGIIYPAVEEIRALYSKMSGKSLYDALQKKMTDSDEDMEKKNKIKQTLIDAYQVWIDCANGKRTDTK